MDEQWTQRSRSFGAVAELYDLRRPIYPDALFDTVLGLTTGRRVLDVGAGTGRASLALADRGACVLAVEPDPGMADVLRNRIAGRPVEVQVATFEEAAVSPGEFDLVVAAQSWHWVDHKRGSAAAASALRPGGRLCVWWNRAGNLTGRVWDAIGGVYAALAPDLKPVHLARSAETVDVIQAPGFAPWTQERWSWTQEYTADDYIDLLSTHSDHSTLPRGRRELILDAVHAAIRQYGDGRVTYPYVTVLLHAELSR